MRTIRQATTPLLLRLAGGALGLGLVGLFAFDGPSGLLALAALGLTATLIVIALPARFRLAYVPLVYGTVVFGQVARGIYLYEPAVPVLALLALFHALNTRTRAAGVVTAPGWFALATSAVPLLAAPLTVVSMESFLAYYKIFVGWAVTFVVLRRLVPRARSNVLLWIFPLVGAIGSLQLMIKTRGLGSQLVSRLSFRTFYTTLPWGTSDFVSAVMEFMICGCVLLFVLERRPLARAVVAGCAVLSLAAFLVLLSRGGAIGLLVFGLVVVLGIGGRRTLVAALGLLAALAATMFTPGGQALLGRFSDPSQQGSVYFRFVLWSISWSRFLSSPWTGVGLNQAKFQHDLVGANWGGNFLLDYMAEQGVFGGLLLCAILVAAFRLAARAEPAGVHASFRPVRAVVVGMLLEWMIHGAVEPTLGGPALTIPFVFLLAWLTLQDPRGRSAAAPLPAPLNAVATPTPAQG